jgi:hypothetical protein
MNHHLGFLLKSTTSQAGIQAHSLLFATWRTASDSLYRLIWPVSPASTLNKMLIL